MSVLVVVPVYGDLPSLLDCVDSLIEHVDLGRHRILLANDAGPEADTIERALLGRIEGVAGVRYERNPENLGFVGNCNRAVFELDDSDDDVLLVNSDAVATAGFLDEMIAVLDASPDHGVVTARSNNATIASLPFRLADPRSPRSFERTVEVRDAVVDLLPRWYTPPVAMGFCFLVRRSLIKRFGFFDEAFAPGYGEENDFCLRIGEQGHLSTMANRALVFHAGSKSFSGSARNALRTAHQRELDRRYPYYGEAVQAFLRHDVVAADRFADLLVPAGPARVVLDARGVPASDVAGLATSFAAAFSAASAGGAWLPEVVADEGVSLDLPCPVRTDIGDDELVTATFLVAGSALPRTLVGAHRRSVVIASVVGSNVGAQEQADTTPLPWSSAAARRGAADVAKTLGAVAGLATDPSFASAAEELTALLSAPLPARVAAIESRRGALRLVDRAVDDAGPAGGAEVERLRAELRDLRASRTYRAGETIARLVPRGRHK